MVLNIDIYVYNNPQYHLISTMLLVIKSTTVLWVPINSEQSVSLSNIIITIYNINF